MTDMLIPSKRAGSTTLRVPAEAWAILAETLSMDARSTAFDPSLRVQIATALRQVEEVDPIETVVPLVTTRDLDAVVDDLMNGRLLDQDGRPYSREQVEDALASWLGQLTENLFENLAQHARDSFRWATLELPPHSDLDLAEEARGECADREYERARERVTA